MARDPVLAESSLAGALRTFRRPWPVLGAGLVCTVIGLAFSQTSLVPLRLLFLAAGLLLAGIAVARRLQTASWEWEDRLESAGLLGVSAFVILLSLLAVAKEESWDSAHLFLKALLAAALGGAFLVLLSRTGRRVAALVLVLLHFGGILTAVTGVPPRGAPSPWLSAQLWTHFYRHYLNFAYLTNAYHFYSPDPGPATLLWFHVEYADGSVCWVKYPNRHASPIGLHHQRMLAAAESIAAPANFLLENQEQIKEWEEKYHMKYELLPGIPHDPGEEIMKRRKIAPDLYKFVDPNDKDKDGRFRPAPLYPVLPLSGQPQYAEPMDMARRLISSYARHIAHTTPDPRDPSNTVRAVRVYRVVHNMLTPRELYEGKDPVAETTFQPFYMGKYDPDGRLLDPTDPYLFWYVPIIRVPKRYPEPNTYMVTPDGPMMFPNWQPTEDDPGKIIDFVEIHATQSDLFHQENPEK